MDTGFIRSFPDSPRQDLPTALAVLGIIVGGWLLALIGRGLTRSLLTRTGLDRRLMTIFGDSEEAGAVNLTSWVSRIVYYLILLLVIVTLLERLGLGAAAAPLSAVLAQIDDWLARQADVEAAGAVSISATLGSVVYWLVFLLFLPAILNALNVQLTPVEGMGNEILGALPNILGAAIVLIVGGISALNVRQTVTHLQNDAVLYYQAARTGVAAAL